MDWMTFAAGLGIGAYLGWGYRRLWYVVKHNIGLGERMPSDKPKPIELVSIHAYSSPATIAKPTQREEWDRAVTLFAFWGDLCAWSERRMFAEGVASRPNIRRYRQFLAEHDLIVLTERGYTTWVRGWDRHRFRMEIKRQMLSLPYPNHEPWPLRRRWITAQTAQRSADGADGAEG